MTDFERISEIVKKQKLDELEITPNLYNTRHVIFTRYNNTGLTYIFKLNGELEDIMIYDTSI